VFKYVDRQTEEGLLIYTLTLCVFHKEYNTILLNTSLQAQCSLRPFLKINLPGVLETPYVQWFEAAHWRQLNDVTYVRLSAVQSQ